MEKSFERFRNDEEFAYRLQRRIRGLASTSTDDQSSQPDYLRRKKHSTIDTTFITLEQSCLPSTDHLRDSKTSTVKVPFVNSGQSRPSPKARKPAGARRSLDGCIKISESEEEINRSNKKELNNDLRFKVRNDESRKKIEISPSKEDVLMESMNECRLNNLAKSRRAGVRHDNQVRNEQAPSTTEYANNNLIGYERPHITERCARTFEELSQNSDSSASAKAQRHYCDRHGKPVNSKNYGPLESLAIPSDEKDNVSVQSKVTNCKIKKSKTNLTNADLSEISKKCFESKMDKSQLIDTLTRANDENMWTASGSSFPLSPAEMNSNLLMCLLVQMEQSILNGDLDTSALLSCFPKAPEHLSSLLIQPNIPVNKSSKISEKDFVSNNIPAQQQNVPPLENSVLQNNCSVAHCFPSKTASTKFLKPETDVLSFKHQNIEKTSQKKISTKAAISLGDKTESFETIVSDSQKMNNVKSRSDKPFPIEIWESASGLKSPKQKRCSKKTFSSDTIGSSVKYLNTLTSVITLKNNSIEAALKILSSKQKDISNHCICARNTYHKFLQKKTDAIKDLSQHNFISNKDGGDSKRLIKDLETVDQSLFDSVMDIVADSNKIQEIAEDCKLLLKSKAQGLTRKDNKIIDILQMTQKKKRKLRKEKCEKRKLFKKSSLVRSVLEDPPINDLNKPLDQFLIEMNVPRTQLKKLKLVTQNVYPGKVVGMAILKDMFYIAVENKNKIFYSPLNKIDQKKIYWERKYLDMSDPRDMVSSGNHLFVLVGCQEIFKIDPEVSNSQVRRWKLLAHQGSDVVTLSCLNNGNLMAVNRNPSRLIEFDVAGHIICVINLTTEIANVSHAVQLDRSRFVVCCAGPRGKGICLVDRNGNVIFNKERCKNGIRPCNSELWSGISSLSLHGLLNMPVHLAVDSSNLIYVADFGYGRIINSFL